MLNYYDLVLGLIPVTLLGVTGALIAFGIELTHAIPGGALVALGLICHGLFVRSPGTTKTSDPRARSVEPAAD